MLTFHRTNPKGMKFTLSGDKKETLIFHDKKTLRVDHPFEVINKAWYNWQMKGQLIQQAFHFFSPAEREFLITGMTEVEWNELFKDEEEV